MKRRRLLSAIAGLLGSATLMPALAADKPLAFTRLSKTKAQWKALLPPETYQVMFEEGTEAPFTSALNKEKREGTFICYACNLPLFDSNTKYDSGTGWPSFFTTKAKVFDTKTDHLLMMARTEYHCARCGGHHGHVFEDGPKPTGLRYCNNGVALKFVPTGSALPALRV